MCYRVLEKLGKTNNPLFELALKLEEIALKDDYFVSRKLYPNVDFYSGIIYSALGIPALHVHRDVRDRAHGRLGGAVAGNGVRSAHENRPAAPALHRPHPARLPAHRKALIDAKPRARRFERSGGAAALARRE
jgi:hypothetical protein